MNTNTNLKRVASRSIYATSKKKNQFNDFEKLINKLSEIKLSIEDDLEIGTLLSGLYRHYLPSTKPTKTSLNNPNVWVSQAIAKDKDTILNLLCVKDGVIYATDTLRLYWNKTDLKDGYYNNKFTEVEHDSKFPMCADLIKSSLKDALQINSTIQEILDTKEMNYVLLDCEIDEVYTPTVWIKIGDKYFNPEYVEPAMKDGAKIYLCSEGGAVYIENIDGTKALTSSILTDRAMKNEENN